MSVRIPIQADASQTLQAIEAIRAALRGAGVDAQSLANVDLSNIGSKDLVRDLERVVQNMGNMAQMARGETAAAARKMFGTNPNISDLYHLVSSAEAVYPEEKARQKFLANYGAYAFRGTSFDPANNPSPVPPPPPPPDPPPPPPPPPADDSGKKIWGKLKDGLMTGLGFFLAQAGIGSAVGVAGAALQAGESENENSDRLLRRTGDLSTSFDQLIKTSDYLHKGLLTTRIDFERYADTYASASGAITAASAMRGARLAVGEAVSFGSDPGSFSRGFGQANFLGVEPEKFAAMVGESAVRGSMGGRVEEVMGALLHAMENASRVSATRSAVADNMGGFVDLYTAMNASGSPMLRGQNGASVIDSINGSIMGGGGGGLAGQVLTMRAMMGAGISDPYAVQMQLAGGAFARVGKGRQTNFDVIEGELRREYGPLGKDREAIAAGTLFNINPRVARQLLELRGQHVDLAGLDESLKPFGGIAGVNPTALNDIIRVQSGQAGFDELQGMSRHLLRNGNLSQANADALKSADSAGTLRTALIAALAQSGMPQTDQSRATEATVKMTDALANLGRTLVDVVTPLKDKLADLATAAEPIAEWARNQLQPDDAKMDDGHVKFGSRSPETFPGGNHDWVDPGDGGPRVLPQHVDRYSSLMARIGQAESGLGTNPAAHGNIYGLIGSTWLDDIKTLARTDPEVAATIAGKSDEELKSLRDLGHTELQRKVAQFEVNKIRRRLGSNASDMDVYASWAAGIGAGPGIMHASDDTPMSNFFTKDGLAANPSYRHMTVGQWKKAHRELFPDMQGSAWGGMGGPGSPVSGQVKIVPAGPLRIILDDAKRRVQSEHHAQFDAVWDGQAVPHGTGGARPAGAS